MTLLPEVERELLRVARLPLPALAPGEEPDQSHSVRRLSVRRLSVQRLSARRRAARLFAIPRVSPSTLVAVAVAILALAIGAVFVTALRSGRTAAQPGHRQPTGTANPFPGAPRTQKFYGVAVRACPLAPPNRYLPARSGCVTVLRADLEGNGRPDLVIAFSHLSRQRRLGSLYVATSSTIEVVRPNGHTVSAQIKDASPPWLDADAAVGADPGVDLFVEINRTSSGVVDAVYSFHAGRLLSAGVALGYGGDSASRAGFDCVRGSHPRVVQNTFELVGPTIYASWNDTTTVYAWRGARLVRVSQHTFRRRGFPSGREISIGAGCTGRPTHGPA